MAGMATADGRKLRSAWSVYGLLVLAAVAYCPMLFTAPNQWGRGDWDQFTFRYATPRLAMLRDGQLPLWNPYTGGGNVLLAHPHCPALSLWYLPTMILGAPLGLRLGVVLFMGLGAVGMAVLLRRWDVSLAGCFTGGVLLMMSAHFAMHITEGHLEWCLLGLMPWVLWCLVRTADDWRYVILGSLILASALLHGSIYIVAVFVPMLGIWAALEGIRTRSWRAVAGCAMLMALTFLLSAVVLFPRIQFLRANPRKTEVYEQVAFRALPRMLLDPLQADLFRATRDIRNPPAVELARALSPQSESSARPYEALKWYRLEVEASTTSDWTDVRIEGSPFIVVPGGPEAANEFVPRLDSMPLATEGLAIKNPAGPPSVAKGRATIFARLPEQGDMQVAITRGNAPATKATVRYQGRVVLDVLHSKRVPGDLSNRQLFAIPRDVFLESTEPAEESGAGAWYRLEATVKTTADWCNVQVVNCPYLFCVEQPEAEAGNPVRLSASSLSISSRRSEDPEAVRRAILLLRCPEEGDVHFSITQGRFGTTDLTVCTLQGDPLETVCEEKTAPDADVEKAYECKLAADVIRKQLRAEPPPWRWRLDELGMTRDWHEYGCYVTWLGLAMAALGLAVSFRRQWPLITTALVAMLIVLGSALPVSLWAIWKQLPMYGSLQAPSRFLVAAVFVVAVCAGYGVDRLGRWIERAAGAWIGRLVPWAVAVAIYAELAVLGWNLFSDVFVCPPRPVPAHQGGEFTQRFADDDVRYSAMYSALYPYMRDNSGVLREYENIAVPRGEVRIAGDPNYRGEAYLEGSHGMARIDGWSMSRVRVLLEGVDAPDRLVLNQNYFAGWKAIRRGLGGTAERLPADRSPGGLVSVAVRSGDREVEFYYRPDSLLWGAIVSGLALLGCLAVLLAGTRESRRAWKPAQVVPGTEAFCAALVQSKAFCYVVVGVVLNAPFLLCHPGWTLVDAPLARSVAVNAVLFLAPGLPLVGIMVGRRWLPRWGLLWVIAASIAVFVVVLVTVHLAGLPPTSSTIWTAIWIFTNAALLLSVLAGGPPTGGWLAAERSDAPAKCRLALHSPGQPVWIGILLFSVAYLMFFHGATEVVPAMDDHDYETQGTAYGLATRLQMTLLTDRHTDYCYAHPPLVHLNVAGSFLCYGRLDDLHVYDAAWERVQLAEQGSRISAQGKEVQMLYDHFRNNPQRLATRTPNVFLAALTVGLLGWWIARMTGHGWLGMLVPLAYATNPEVFVRSSYGGYFAISNFALVQILLTVQQWTNERSRFAWMDCMLAGAFAGLANHKLILLPAAVVLWETIQLWPGWTPGRMAKAVLHPVAIGFAAGWMAFCIYGLAVSPDVFCLEHFRHHLVDRIAHVNPLGYGEYPTVLGLWREFLEHTGYVLLPLAVVSLALLCGSREAQPDGSEPKRAILGWRGAPGLWAVWAVLIAVAFSLIDWRQTKHLMPLLLPLHLAPARWAARGQIAMVLVGGLFGGLLLWNLGELRLLTADFAAFSITPAW